MAIIVASALMVAIAPVVTISAAARVQARRVDLATQAARSYIDGLRANAIDPPTTRGANFTPLGNQGGGDLGVPAPSSLQDGSIEQCLDKNLNSLRTSSCSSPDNFLVIQAFRDGPLKKQEAITQGYCVGMRVYRADAFEGSTRAETQPTKSSIAVSLNSKKYPLVVMRTQITNKTSFADYQNFYKVNPNNSNSRDKAIPSPCD